MVGCRPPRCQNDGGKGEETLPNHRQKEGRHLVRILELVTGLQEERDGSLAKEEVRGKCGEVKVEGSTYT